ncbi:MAG: hypothetical protein IJZ90_04855 [Clostridia bacterium]|nr:hypothetical protein [Clostridia bacterium]
MKKVVYKVLLFVLAAVTVCAFSACDAEYIESDIEPVLADGMESVTVRAPGVVDADVITYPFVDTSDDIVVSAVTTDKDIEDSTICESCGYTEYCGEPAYRICYSGKIYYGMKVTLKVPVRAELVSDMSMTYMTSADAKSSEICILSNSAVAVDDAKNDCPELLGAVDGWQSVSLGIGNFNDIAGSSGYIESFTVLLCNNDGIDFYLKDISIEINPEVLCDVELTERECMTEKGTLEVIAEKIKNNFKEMDLSAEITVRCLQYKSNTSASDGEISYSVVAKVSEKEVYYTEKNGQIIPHLEGVWLSGDDPFYGVEMSWPSDWYKEFSNEGILLFEDHSISCNEGLKTLEYAIIDKPAEVYEEETVWYPAQRADIDGDIVKEFYADANVDYAGMLAEGESYYFAVRAVTNSDNYISHIAYEFTYEKDSGNMGRAVIYVVIAAVVILAVAAAAAFFIKRKKSRSSK